MPVLANARHECFAQELAKGKSASEAYEIAGFKPSRPNASRLQHADNILQRIAEIRSAGAAMAQEATQKAAESLAIDREWVLARLQDNALRAAESGDYAPSNRALELIGKEIAGMFVDRKHVDIDAELRGIPDDHLLALFESAVEEGSGASDGAGLVN